MKALRYAVTIVSLGMLLPSAAAAFGTVTGEERCQGCHSEFADGTWWHLRHQRHVDQECSVCHGSTIGRAIPTSRCLACHDYGGRNRICPLAAIHEVTPIGVDACFRCHDSCTLDDLPDDTCVASVLLGEDDPRLAQLRIFRDETLAATLLGRRLISWYYTSSAAVLRVWAGE